MTKRRTEGKGGDERGREERERESDREHVCV